MTFLLLSLLQQQPRGISRVVIVGAALAFIAGVSLLVYFYRRYKGIEKETEEDWDMSRRSLFVSAPPPAARTETGDQADAVETGTSPPAEAPAQTTGTREFASANPPAAEPFVTPSEPRAEMQTPPEARIQTEAFSSLADSTHLAPDHLAEEPKQARPTEVFASPVVSEPEPATRTEHEPAPFDDEIWAGLESVDETHTVQPEPPQTTPLVSATQPPNVARVDARPLRAPFEPPRIERIEHREAYEPPRIQPLTPREQAATRELRSAPPPHIVQTGEEPGRGRSSSKTLTAADAEERRRNSARETGVLGSSLTRIAAPVKPEHVEMDASELAPEPSIAGGYARKRASGSILGLPAEASSQPLIFGDSARSTSEAGIGALSNYGKDIGPKAGRGGTIVLLLVVVLLGGGVLLFLFVPSVHSWVTRSVAHLRGTDTQLALEASLKQRAQIIPSFRPEVNKNQVTARGAVDNISDEPLEGLSIEVSLQRGGDSGQEIRNVAVVPSPLPPGQRGTFEFEYDGKRDTGFTGYKITRLLSNGTEVRFRMPGQK